MVRSERCACRGYIEVQDETDECEVRDAVRDHNRGEQHQQYMAFGNDPMPSTRNARHCAGLDETGCGRRIGPMDAMCYSCARREALGRQAAGRVAA